MNAPVDFKNLEVGYDVPALPGMDEKDIQTPCLILDLDALERNIKKMGDYAKAHGMRHRVHGKMHKSVDVALLQEKLGGSCGVCCQKVSRGRSVRPRRHQGCDGVEPGAPIRPRSTVWRGCRSWARGFWSVSMIRTTSRICRRPRKSTARRSSALVEIDCGAGRCGVTTTQDVVNIAKLIDAAPGLKFAGIQAYQGAMQHLDSYEDRKAKLDIAIAQVADAVKGLKAQGLECDIVGGGGTGSYYFESNSGVYNELQCGSYAFMDADYGRILDKDGKRIDQGEWENALFILTTVMSHAKADKAIVDAGLKAQSVDSGLPKVYGRDDVEIPQMFGRTWRGGRSEGRAEGQRQAAAGAGAL